MLWPAARARLEFLRNEISLLVLIVSCRRSSHWALSEVNLIEKGIFDNSIIPKMQIHLDSINTS